MYDTVIFDMDGTLLNTLDDLADGVNHTLSTFHYPVHTVEEIRSYIGNGARNLIKRSLPEGTQDPVIDEVLADYKAFYNAHADIKTRPYDGILSMLETLKEKGIKLAILSNKQDEAVRDLTGKYFPELITCSAGEKPGIPRKPDPAGVFEIMKELGSKKAVYVGDFKGDKETADNAGMDCILVTWGYGRDLQELNPAYLISDPSEIIEIVI